MIDKRWPLWPVAVAVTAGVVPFVFRLLVDETSGATNELADAKGARMVAVEVQLSPRSGWGIFALNVLAHLDSHGEFWPVVTARPSHRCESLELQPGAGESFVAWAYQRMLRSQGGLWTRLDQRASSRRAAAVAFDAEGVVAGMASVMNAAPAPPLILHGVPQEFEDGPEQHRLWGGHNNNIGAAFFERDRLSPAAVRNARAYDLVLAGSTWNLRTLQRHGVRHSRLILQGVDTQLFAPLNVSAPELPLPRSAAGRLVGDRRQRFVVFSGGKLELRKGQDLVVAAFRKFLQLHEGDARDIVLATTWYNQWPATVTNIDASHSGHVRGSPRFSTNHSGGYEHMHVEEWLEENGVPADRGLHMQEVSQREIAALLQRADVAIFPNRAEGGTNLAAMEAMASGVPVIISNNTGHVDIVDEAHCFPLSNQQPLRQPGLEGWSDSFIDEIVYQLEMVYTDPDDAQQRGRAAAAFIRERFSWEHAIKHLSSILRDFERQQQEGSNAIDGTI